MFVNIFTDLGRHHRPASQYLLTHTGDFKNDKINWLRIEIWYEIPTATEYWSSCIVHNWLKKLTCFYRIRTPSSSSIPIPINQRLTFKLTVWHDLDRNCFKMFFSIFSLFNKKKPHHIRRVIYCWLFLLFFRVKKYWDKFC